MKQKGSDLVAVVLAVCLVILIFVAGAWTGQAVL